MFCMKCRSSTKTKNEKESVSANGRNMLKGQCTDCGGNKSKIVSGGSKPIPIPKKKQTGGMYNEKNKREFNDDFDFIEEKKKGKK